MSTKIEVSRTAWQQIATEYQPEPTDFEIVEFVDSIQAWPRSLAGELILSVVVAKERAA